MPQQFQNPDEQKVENEVAPVESSDKRLENLAEKAAQKGAKREQKYDKDHGIISI
ncbi:MAG TPA: hypothetical protein VMW15_12035 [Terracidiphilus sp.]|jgi:hypothetical protein|nr:hypothetical protein [Terracidiphilus sp.]